MRRKKTHTKLILALCIMLIATGFIFFAAPRLFSFSYDSNNTEEAATSTHLFTRTTPLKKKEPDVIHHKTPEPLKAIYMSSCVVATPNFRDKLVKLIDNTELNALIIDIKDFSGKISYPTDNPALSFAVSDGCKAPDMKEFIKMLHDKNIYVIGRITVFQDPLYTKLHPEAAVKRADGVTVWKDYKGLSFVDVGAEDFWKYISELAKESYRLGFDELNFDYVRYPSDGPMSDIAFTHSGGRKKEIALEEFFSFLYEQLKNYRGEDGTSPVISADLFGLTTTAQDDMNIGQVLVRALPYFDYVMPMVYPSHYPNHFNGWANPAAVPYEIIQFSMSSAVRRARMLGAAPSSTGTTTEALLLKDLSEKGHGDVSPLQLRPWLQDFDLGATYTADMVRKQIQATYDVGLTSWALWDAGNTYTKDALLSE